MHLEHAIRQSPGYKANQMEPQLAVSYPDRMNQFGGVCQVMMAVRGEKSDENMVDEDLVVKRNSTSAIWTYSGFRRDDVYRCCVKHAVQLLRLLEEIQPTSITTCNTTKTYTSNSKLTLAFINCIVNNMQTLIFVDLSQVILSLQY